MEQTPASHYDVVICGSGSAGLCAATWLARTGIRALILESRAGPMAMGQADGVQCRTVEVYESFGLADTILREAHHQHEVTFWGDEGHDGPGIVRTGRMADTPPGLSHHPHLILNQARMNAVLIEAMHRFNGQTIEYGYEVLGVKVDPSLGEHCVTVRAKKEGVVTEFRSKYALACDGAHSAVRKSLGFKMVGDSSDDVWGVIDAHVRTDFPDIRKKAVIQSKEGNILTIPREGQTLIRFYVEIPPHLHSKTISAEDLQSTIQAILSPYTIEFVQIVWHSAYKIGQRHADFFHEMYRVFLTGDACHTHSPKAGQGMNVSLQDGFNIGWKLAHVLKGIADPKLLETYVEERRETAINLIDFDRDWTKLWAARRNDPDFDPEALNTGFKTSARYTAGLTAKYSDSLITSEKRSRPEAASALTIGMRFPSTTAVRFCDACPLHLAKALPADGRWRVIVFPGDIRDPTKAETLSKITTRLEKLARRFTPRSRPLDYFIDPVLIVSTPKTELEWTMIPEYYWPRTGELDIQDLYKVYVDDEAHDLTHGHAYEFYGINETGAVAVVRPDQYISILQYLNESGIQIVEDFFAGFTTSEV